MRVPQGTLKIEGFNDVQISYEQMCETAFDPNIPNEEAAKYQKALISARNTAKRWKADFDRFLFFIRPETGEIIQWFD